MNDVGVIDKDNPVCKFVAEEKHPNIKNKKLMQYTLNIDKIEDTAKAIKDGKIPQKDLSRTIQVSPSKADETWMELIYDLDFPRKNLESPRSKILKIYYEHENTGKAKPLKIKYIGKNQDLEHLYYFVVRNKDDAEYKLPYVVNSFLEVEIRIIKFEYREANDAAWELLDGSYKNLRWNRKF